MCQLRVERRPSHNKYRKEDFDANQSELNFLRIQLQAIQAQCSQYIPDDLELSQSIDNWKVDWEDIDKRSKERRAKCHPTTVAVASLNTP